MKMQTTLRLWLSALALWLFALLLWLADGLLLAASLPFWGRRGFRQRHLVARDQIGNVYVGSGHADEMLSARAWRCRNESRAWAAARWLIDTLFFWQPDHCKHCYASEMLRQQMPREYRP